MTNIESRGRIGYCVATHGYRPEEHARRLALARPWIPENADVEIVVIEGGPEYLDRAHDFDTAVSAAVNLLQGLDPARFDVLIAAGAIDPGLALIRESSPVPVVGPGEASMYLASLIGRPLSIVTVDEHAIANSHVMLDRLKIKPPIASVRGIDMPVRQIVQDLDRARDRLVTACLEAVRQDGAEVIYLGAMTLGTLGVEDRIREEAGVRVINPIEVAFATATQVMYTKGAV